VVRVGAEIKDAGNMRNARLGANGWTTNTPFPPDTWMAPDFDDSVWSGWSRPHPRPKDSNPVQIGTPTLALECFRGRFRVTDLSQVGELTLSLEYRGGAVVYLNGEEVARGHLAKSNKPDFAALAEDYPREAFLYDGPPYNGSNCIRDRHGEKCRAQIERRVRKIENVTLNPKRLLKGVNVLAVEVHRAPYFGPGLEMDDANHRSIWGPCGLVGVSLRAGSGAASMGARAKGPEVWNASPLIRLNPGCRSEPGVKLGPINIIGCRNGRFCGKVVVSSDGALKGVKAAATELKTKDGKVIPAATVKFLYTTRDDAMTGWTYGDWIAGPGFAGQTEKLYACAAEVAAKTGAQK
jgi:hypothetical protein